MKPSKHRKPPTVQCDELNLAAGESEELDSTIQHLDLSAEMEPDEKRIKPYYESRPISQSKQDEYSQVLRSIQIIALFILIAGTIMVLHGDLKADMLLQNSQTVLAGIIGLIAGGRIRKR